MKMNWGTGITLAIILFMGFIIFMVVKASRVDFDLESKDYYEQEINYQARIDAQKNASLLKGDFQFFQNKSEFTLEFPADLSNSVIEGTLHFFKPENAKFDRKFQINRIDNKQNISKEELVPGNYVLKIDWKHRGSAYYVEKKIHVEQ